jgi:hypothetical protein
MEKTYISFSFKSLTSDFSELFLFYSSNSIWIRIRTFFSDSDPAKTFGFGSTTLLLRQVVIKNLTSKLLVIAHSRLCL